MPDTRIAYGARCAWWDSIQKVGKTPPKSSGLSLPCCPTCGGVLYEVDSEETWFGSVDRHEAAGNPGYRAMIEWGRGKCFASYDALEAAYKAKDTHDNTGTAGPGTLA